MERSFRIYREFEKKLKKSTRIDARYSVLEFRYTKDFLHVFTDSLRNAISVSRAYERMSVRSNPVFKIKVSLLPDRSVGNFVKGVCHVGVAPVRRSSTSSSEQVTQVLYGESFDALQIFPRTRSSIGDWIRVRLHADGYIGWVSSNQVTLFPEDEFKKYRSFMKAYVVERISSLFEKPSINSPAVREAVFGSELIMVGQEGIFFEVKLPDGPSAYVKKSDVSVSPLAKRFSMRNLFATAKNFEGISYVWGGRSAKGFDCSGFVQTVFRLNGIELPRDTDLQFSAGKFVGRTLNKVRPGDLLFFSSNGNKISHVAIYFGRNKEFIHSSGFIKISSLDPRRENFSRKLFSGFVGACRVIS
ncbi:MAG TPA: NlpC/P60 family protein [Candidatus Acidoferrales bacterium]|nr:NlpC/P60 family protein [Candidatus Acidoferrales bacterium]